MQGGHDLLRSQIPLVLLIYLTPLTRLDHSISNPVKVHDGHTPTNMLAVSVVACK